MILNQFHNTKIFVKIVEKFNKYRLNKYTIFKNVIINQILNNYQIQYIYKWLKMIYKINWYNKIYI
jgi:hypothetical protein